MQRSLESFYSGLLLRGRMMRLDFEMVCCLRNLVCDVVRVIERCLGMDTSLLLS